MRDALHAVLFGLRSCGPEAIRSARGGKSRWAGMEAVGWWVYSALAVAGCTDYNGWDGRLEQPDQVTFEAEVYPVLLRDCGFQGCHGDLHRYLLVMGPGRTRLSPDLRPADPPDPREILLSYERSRSMLSTAEPVTRSLLLLKPLSTAAGGASHKGTDALGRDVYRSADEAGYQALLTWALSLASPASPAAVP